MCHDEVNIFKCMGKISVWNLKGYLWNDTDNKANLRDLEAATGL